MKNVLIKVMDSYLHLKMSDALSDLKQEFVTTETKVAKVLREKEILEEVLKKKMQCIKVWPHSMFFLFSFCITHTKQVC